MTIGDPNDPTVKVTITIKESLEAKLRKRQTDTVMKTGKGYAFSTTITDILEEHLKK